MRTALSVLLIAHGLAHTVGFVGAWHLSAKAPGLTALFRGRLKITAAAEKALGLLWLVVAALFTTAGVWGVIGVPLWFELAVVASVISMVICVAAWPLTKLGVAVNAALWVLLPLGQLGWVPLLRFLQT